MNKLIAWVIILSLLLVGGLLAFLSLQRMKDHSVEDFPIHMSLEETFVSPLQQLK